MISIAILASGQGNGFSAISDAIGAEKLSARIVAVISDRPDAPVLEKAERAGFLTRVVEREKDRVVHDTKILAALDALPEGRPRFLVMAGYMRIVTPQLIAAFREHGKNYSRIVNIHPSLLPAFPGVGGYAQAFEHGAQLAGVTVHLVDDGLDSGPICAQESFSISACQSAQEVERLGKEIEHRLYPETLGWVLPERFALESRATSSLNYPANSRTNSPRRFYVRSV